MQALQRLLFDGLDPDGLNIRAACGFEQGGGIGRIGLVTFDIGANVASRQQSNFDPEILYLPRPVVGTAAGFHDDQ
jgi:hypothetical protein